MKPVINSHLDYRRFLNGIGGMYRINWRSKPPAIREIYLRFRELDLSAVDRIMQNQVTIGPDGIPICKAGLKMKSNGNDLRRLYAKFRCPLNNNGITFSESNPYF